ncbi:MAG: DUF45 domain-containing protein [Methylococcaceae bacterium]|nr:DUF45 domain-containing protein [Methylococcaceae bacterium]
MTTQIQLGNIAVDVVKKNIKNLHLSVHPPEGKVRISAPLRMDIDTIRVFALTKLSWIKKQQQKLQAQAREMPPEYLDRESHYLWGKRYLLELVEKNSSPKITLEHNKIRLQIRPASTEKRKQDIIEAWYREQLKQAIEPLIEKWEPLMGVKVEKFFVRKMKTKWGSCRPATKSIRLNTDLVRKPPECLEYVVVHEMVHLLEASHNKRFIALMDQFMPKWRFFKDELNRLPLRYED